MKGNVPDLQTLHEHGQLLMVWIAAPIKLLFSLGFRIGAGISVMCELAVTLALITLKMRPL